MYDSFLHCSVARLCQCGALGHSESIVTLRALPTLVRLCKAPGDIAINTQAAHAMGELHLLHVSQSTVVLCIIGMSLTFYFLFSSILCYGKVI